MQLQDIRHPVCYHKNMLDTHISHFYYKPDMIYCMTISIFIYNVMIIIVTFARSQRPFKSRFKFRTYGAKRLFTIKNPYRNKYMMDFELENNKCCCKFVSQILPKKKTPDLIHICTCGAFCCNIIFIVFCFFLLLYI